MATEDLKVIEREYGPEQAGQRVGWVSVDTVPDTDLWGRPMQDINADITVATVGESGARLGYTRREHDGEVRHLPFPESRDGERPADISGFVAVTGLSVTLYKGVSVNEFPPRVEGNLAKYVQKIPRQPDSEKTWFDDEQDCLKLLKGGLVKHGVASAYPALYYYLNAHLAHEGVDRLRSHSPDGFSRVALRPQAPIADPEMRQSTEHQLEIAKSIEAYLRSSLATDEAMRRILDSLSKVGVQSFPDMFEANRRTVSSHEGAVLQSAKQLVIRASTYMPIGSGPSGRERPFMDPTPSAAHPDGNYTHEINALRKDDSSLARDELNREIDELKERVLLAERGRVMFAALLTAEQK